MDKQVGLTDEEIQEAADKYPPVFEIDGKQLSKVEILQRQHARLRAPVRDQLKRVVEYITDKMHDNDFSSIVYFHPGKEFRDWKGRWVVGNLTGIDSDLVCVKRCNTREDERRYLSPAGDNIIDALDKAVALLDQVKE